MVFIRPYKPVHPLDIYLICVISAFTKKYNMVNQNDDKYIYIYTHIHRNICIALIATSLKDHVLLFFI